MFPTCRNSGKNINISLQKFSIYHPEANTSDENKKKKEKKILNGLEDAYKLLIVPISTLTYISSIYIDTTRTFVRCL